MFTDVETYYKQVMDHGTPPAKVLIQEEALMSRTLAEKLATSLNTDSSGQAIATEADTVNIQKEIMALLIVHRSMVIANWAQERAVGIPMGQEGPVVTAQPLMEENRPEGS